MWTTAAALGGLVVAALLWRFALTLIPHEHGVAISALPRRHQLIARLATVLGGATSAALVVTVWPRQPDLLAFGLFAAVTPGLVVIDLVAHRLPFTVSVAVLAGAATGFSAQAVSVGDAAQLGRAAWALIVVGALALVWWWAFDGQTGLGDVVLLAVIGVFAGWLSWAAVLVAVFVGFTLAALVVLSAGAARGRTGRVGAYLPLGPFLLAGWWAAFALGVSS